MKQEEILHENTFRIEIHKIMGNGTRARQAKTIQTQIV